MRTVPYRSAGRASFTRALSRVVGSEAYPAVPLGRPKRAERVAFATAPTE